MGNFTLRNICIIPIFPKHKINTLMAKEKGYWLSGKQYRPGSDVQFASHTRILKR